ncbi:hypothetical protein CsatB_002742 [Cannabis sativa]
MMETDKFPLAPPHNFIRSDQEVSHAAAAEDGLRRKKRRRRIQSAAAFVVLLIVVVLIYALVVIRFKTPKFRIREAMITSSQISNFTNNNNSSSNLSMNLILEAEFTIKNRNFGRFKYESGSVLYAYKGFVLGQAFIDDGRVRPRSTKKVRAVAVLNSAGLGSQAESELGRDIGAGVLSLTSYSELEGRIRVVRVIKRKKWPKLNCTMDFVIATRMIQNLNCL